MKTDKPTTLSLKVGYLWAFVNAAGINGALIISFIIAANITDFTANTIVYFAIVWFVTVTLITFVILTGQWFLLAKKINRVRHWIIASITGWILSFGIIFMIYILAEHYFGETADQLGSVILVMLIILVMLSVGPIVMMGMLIFFDLRYRIVT